MSARTVLAMLFLPSVALADEGAVVRAGDLGPARAAIAARIAEARAGDPAIFAAVERVDAWRPSAKRRSRSQRPEAVAIVFRRMGPRARFALAELAAFRAPARDGADERSWRALQVALVDAIGAAGDPVLAPILRAAFAGSSDDVASTAAVGLGRLGDSELPSLLAHARAGDARFAAAVRGLGASHRPTAARALADLLDAAPDGEDAARIADALAECGSSWAWATGKLGPRADEESVRATASAALARNRARLPSASPRVDAAIHRVAR